MQIMSFKSTMTMLEVMLYAASTGFHAIIDGDANKALFFDGDNFKRSAWLA